MAVLRPETWGARRRLALLLAPVVAGLIAGFGPGRLAWLLLGVAIVALDRAGHASARPSLRRREPVGVAPRGGRQWRRQLRRRRIINRRRRVSAQRQQARSVREARQRRRRRRNMVRRRHVQARGGWFTPAVETGRGGPAAAGPSAEVDLAAGAEPEASTEIDLTDAVEPEASTEIDLTDRAVYGSEITLESGDILESGVVGSCPEPRAASRHQPHD